MTSKAYHLFRLLLSFVYELLASNIAVLRIVLRPRIRIQPGIVAFHTELRSEAAITCLANMITLTPGTLTLDVSEDRSTLFIHTLDVESPEAVCRLIHETFERHLLELER